MKALINGLSVWITSVFQTAARKGLLILILTGGCLGGGVAVIHLFSELETQRNDLRLEMKAEIAGIRNEYRIELSATREELSACNKAREELAAQVLLLSTEFAIFKNKK